ncbi:MAG: hypothetical protein BWY77_01016 [bacterium ADurb.Bin431]|nr:MAG: hypothetical protein BWY77_01016 [bacterium ADurb.Bin431]
MGVTRLFDLLKIEIDGFGVLVDRAVLDGAYRHAAAREHRQLAVIQIGDALDHPHQRGGIGGEEKLLLAVADHQGRAVACGHQGIGMIPVDDSQAVGALYAREPLTDRLAQLHAPFEILLEEMAEHLAVGLGLEGMAFADELIAQEGKILNDAVVHHRDATAAVAVGMGIDRIGLAVGGPTGMADSQSTLRRLRWQYPFQLGDLAGRLLHPDPLIGPERNPGAVIAAVLQPVQPVEQQGQRILTADIAHYPAH